MSSGSGFGVAVTCSRLTRVNARFALSYCFFQKNTNFNCDRGEPPLANRHLNPRRFTMTQTHFLTAVPKTKPSTVCALPLPSASTNMSKSEAEALLAQMAKASSQLFQQVVLLVKYEGYRALGFAQPQPCLRKKVPELSNAYICRLLKAATLYLQLDKTLRHLDQVAEATFRPLQPLDLQESRAVWEKVLQKRPQQKITAQHVKTVLRYLNLHPKMPVKPAPFTVNQALQRDLAFQAQRISRHCLKSHVTNQTEWTQVAKWIYQQLLDNSPFLKTKPQTGEQ